MEKPLEDIRSQIGLQSFSKEKPIKAIRRLITVQINDTMTEFQVGVIESEERKETLYSQTPLYRGEGWGCGGGSGIFGVHH